ncbi:hypothetical protein ACE6ED_24365 [Paenibacillus sp. CN-4]|uniref:hypothetical protein n=1 Tax=Paenibacillus nanchangensis TaxID=3348343 RepID=UPI00397DF24E
MESNIAGAATFYQYKLLKKINWPLYMTRIFIALPILCLIAETGFISPYSILYFLLAAPVMFWIQYVISRSVLLISGYPLAKRWRVLFRIPWIGYLTDQYVSCRIFRKVLLHNFWIGLCISAVFILWSPPAFTVSLTVWHLWLLLPRLYVMLRLRGLQKDGMLKLNPADASYYAQ